MSRELMMRRILATVALCTALSAAVGGGARPARADATGFTVEFREPSSANYYDDMFPYGAWTPLWQARIYPAPGGTATAVHLEFNVLEINPVRPNHLVPAVDIQVDIGHGWQELPSVPLAMTIPATATYSSPYMVYFRFMPIGSQQMATQICAWVRWSGQPPLPAVGPGGVGSCTVNLSFTGTPPTSQPTMKASHAPTTSASRTATAAPGPTSTTPTAMPTPSAAPTQPPTSSFSPTPSLTPSSTSTDTPVPLSIAPVAAPAKPATGWIAVLLGAFGAAAAAVATTVVVLRRRRSRTG